MHKHRWAFSRHDRCQSTISQLCWQPAFPVGCLPLGSSEHLDTVARCHCPTSWETTIKYTYFYPKKEENLKCCVFSWLWSHHCKAKQLLSQIILSQDLSVLIKKMQSIQAFISKKFMFSYLHTRNAHVYVYVVLCLCAPCACRCIILDALELE